MKILLIPKTLKDGKLFITKYLPSESNIYELIDLKIIYNLIYNIIIYKFIDEQAPC
jgi:hypothetical protein